jgi:membrane fusion protein (multidrug efflux system)
MEVYFPLGNFRIGRQWPSYWEAFREFRIVDTAYVTDREPRAPGQMLRTAGDSPILDIVMTVRRKPSTVARVLRLSLPPGRSTVVICLLAALCAGAAVILTGRSAGLTLASESQTTDDAYVRADQITISSHIAGYVASVPVKDNETVSRGQVIATVQDDDYRARLAAADADLKTAQSSVDVLASQALLQNARIAGAEAGVRAAEADLTRARLEHARQSVLVSRSDSPRRNLETAEAADQRLAAERDQRQTDVAAARQTLDVIERQMAQARQIVTMKEAARDLARIELGYTRIVSPVSGQLSARKALSGEYVTPGTQIGLVVPLPNVWVVANFREIQIADMRVGQAASVTIDGVPGQTFHGTVDSAGPVSGALEALLPPDNATGNFTKVAQRFAMKIVLSPDQVGLARLRPGMSVIATVMTSADARKRGDVR